MSAQRALPLRPFGQTGIMVPTLGMGCAPLGDMPRTFNSSVLEGAIVQKKVDRDPQTGSFSAERIRRSVAESLERLGLDRLGIVYLHDPENGSFEEITGPGGAVEELLAMQREGLIAHLGVAGGRWT